MKNSLIPQTSSFETHRRTALRFASFFWTVIVLVPPVSSEAGQGAASGQVQPGEASPVIAPLIVQQPESVVAAQGGSANFSVAATGSTPLLYQWYFNGMPLPGATEPTLALSSLQAADAGFYRVVVSNNSGSVTSYPPASLFFSDTLDTLRPYAAITAPLANARLSNSMVTVTGRAGDDRRVAGVWLRVNDAAWQLADGTTNWIAGIELTPGTNRLQGVAVDWAGNRSATNSLSLFLVVRGMLMLQVSGEGTIMEVLKGGGLTPYLDSQPRELGRSYTVRALPGPDTIFAGWSGGLASGEPTLTFVMRTDLVLQGNFVPNPFADLKGSYNGLFYEADEVRQESSGFVTLSLTEQGKFTARLQSGNKRYPFVGQFALDGRATSPVARAGTNALTVVLTLDLESEAGEISGRITDGNWVAELKADRAVFHPAMNPAPMGGKYTVLLPAGADPSSPAGDGFGVVSVSSSGLLTFKGSLADGTALSQRAALSANGYWPLYGALYGGRGSILGWVGFGDDATTDLAGLVHWIKPALTGRYYPGGFVSETALVGSSYAPLVSAGGRLLAITNAVASFSGGNLSAPFSNQITLMPNNTVLNGSANKLVLKIAKPTGLFSGTAVDPVSGKVLKFKGALLQKQQAGAGFFLGTNESGRVHFGP